MKGLLLKDWYQVKTNMRMMYLTVLAVLAIWILSTSGDSSFAVNYSAVFLGIMPAYLLSYDHASGWTEYIFALPLSNELQVAEKISRGSALHGGLCGAEWNFLRHPVLDGKTASCDADRPFAGGGRSFHPADKRDHVAAVLPFWRRKGADALHADVCRNGRCPGRRMVLMDAVPEPGAAIAIVGVLAAVLVLYALSWRVSVAWYGKYKK